MKKNYFIPFVVVAIAMLSACTSTQKPNPAPVGVFTDTEHRNFYVSDEDTISAQDKGNSGYHKFCNSYQGCQCSPRFRERDTGAPDSFQDWRDRGK